MLNKTAIKRDGFKSKWGFILACIGSAVGMGNIWRFPIMVAAYGGMTFLIPYFIFIVIIAASGVIGEFALGRFGQAGPIGAFGKCTEMRTGSKKPGELIGWIPILGAMGLAIGYTVVMSWIFKYTWMSVSGSLYALGTDMNVIGGTFGAAAPETASIGESIQAVLSGAGNGVWLVIGLIASLIIMALGIADGIEKANKIMMPILFGLFVILTVYIATLPGASNGYKFIFALNLDGIKNPKVWIYAFGQAFFSLSVAGNGSVIYGSYLPKDEAIPSSAWNVALFDTLAALLAMMVIIPSIAASGMDLTTMKGGPGLMFVYLVNVLNGMPGGRIVGMVFYVAILFAGLSSIVNLYETPVAMLQERFHVKRVPAVFTIGLAGGLVAFFIQGYTSQWMDMVSIYICPLGAMLAGCMFFWIMKKEAALEEVNRSVRSPIGSWFHPFGKWVYVPLCAVALIAGALLGGIG